MKLIIYIETTKEFDLFLNEFDNQFECEVVLGCIELSRYTKTSFEDLLILINIANKKKIPVVLDWDILNLESRFKKSIAVLEKIPLHDFKAIRLQDPGAIEYIKRTYPWLKVQLILENGNHNLVGLKSWRNYLGEQCDKLILSNELSKDHLRQYASSLDVPIEIQVLGRILLFYTPRLLLSPLDKKNSEAAFLEAYGSSEESPHNGFPLIENQHGTFMFNVKDLYLLDHLNELSEANITNVRLDLRFDSLFENHVKDLIRFFKKDISEKELKIKNDHIRPMIKGFYNVNKTDILFTKLKNKRIQRNDEYYLGEVVDVERNNQIALLVKRDGEIKENIKKLKLVTPEGKIKEIELKWIRNSQHEEVNSFTKNEIILIPFFRGVTVKTQVYLSSTT